MIQIKIEFDPVLANCLCLDEDSVIEAYYDDGNIVIHVLDEEKLDSLKPDPCSDCLLYYACKSFCNDADYEKEE